MTTEQMRRWLLDARPNWRRETILRWRDDQVVAIYYKEIRKGVRKPVQQGRQLTLF